MSQNVPIRLSNNLVQLTPGESAEVAITVANNTGEVRRLEVTLTDLDPAWYTLDWNELVLYPDAAPGNEGTVYLRLSLPSETFPSSNSPSIVVKDMDSQEIVSSQAFALIVNPPAETPQEITINPPTTTSKAKSARFVVSVRNPLNRPVTARLTSRLATTDPARTTINPPIMEIPAFGTLNAYYDIIPDGNNWAGPDRRYEFSLMSEGQAGEVRGNFVQTPRFPWLRTLLATPWLLVPLILLPLLLVGYLVWVLFFANSAGGNNVAGGSLTPVATGPAKCAPNYNTNTRVTLRMNEATTDILTSVGDRRAIPVRILSESNTRLPGLYENLVSVSPRGTRLAYVLANNPALDDATIVLAGTNGGAKEIVAREPGGLWPFRPIWSPNEDKLAYVLRTGNQLELVVVDIAGNNRQKTTLATQGQLTPSLFYGDNQSGPLCWSQAGDRIIFRSKDDTNIQTEVVLNTKEVLPNQTRPQDTPVAIGAFPQSLPLQTSQANSEQELPLIPPVSPTSECYLRPFSQNDPAWREQPMRVNNDKIGEGGCAISSAAMMLNYLGARTDPNELNICLANNANPFNWELPARLCSSDVVVGGSRDEFSWDGLNTILTAGRPAIVGLLGGQTGIQFVVVLGGYEGFANTYRIADPFDGSSFKSLGDYLRTGYRLQWLVNYEGTRTPSCQARVEPIAKARPELANFSIISPQDGRLYREAVEFQVLNPAASKLTATLFRLSTGSADTVAVSNPVVLPATTPRPGQSGQTNTGGGVIGAVNPAATGVAITPGERIDIDGFYQLGVDVTGADNQPTRLTQYFVLDRVPPIVTLGPRAAALEANVNSGKSQVVNGKVDLEFRATDNLSDIRVIEYNLNNTTWQPYNNDVSSNIIIPFTEPGPYEVRFRATDGAMNTSAEKLLAFTIVNTVIGPDGQPITPTPAVTPTPTPVITPAPTTPPVAGGNGEGNAGNPGGGTGGTGGGNTPAPTTAPVPTTPPPPAALLVANPAAVTIDASQQQAGFALVNSGGSPATWTASPPNDPNAIAVRLNPSTGTLPPGGNINVVVEEISFNFTSAPFILPFVINYNDKSVVVNVTVNPQPTPDVTFAQPASGPLVTTTVGIKLTVTPKGLAKPSRALVAVKYLDKVGGTVEARPTNAVLNAGNSFTGSWAIPAGTPPQDGIEMSARLCWTDDNATCFDIPTKLTGLSIAAPAAIVSLDPPGPSVSGEVTVRAAVSGVTSVDHINYVLTYKKDGADFTETLSAKATSANNYTIKWNTAQIEPQEGIKFEPKVCWGKDDAAASCNGTSNIIAPLKIDPPTVTAIKPTAPISATLKLTGSVTKINNPAAKVYVEFTPEGGQLTTVEGKLGTITAGAATWDANIVNGSLKPQKLVLTPKVCWNGVNNDKCVKGAPVDFDIPDLEAVFEAPLPADFGAPASLKVKVTPARPGGYRRTGSELSF